MITIFEKFKRELNRKINSLRRNRTYNTYNRTSGKSFYRRQVNKIIICILLVLSVLIIKKINVRFTNNIIRIVDKSINYSFDLKEDTKKVFDFVKGAVKIPDKVIETFGTNITK